MFVARYPWITVGKEGRKLCAPVQGVELDRDDVRIFDSASVPRQPGPHYIIDGGTNCSLSKCMK